LLEDGYYTLTIEAAFTSIERTLLFWLITEDHHDPAQPPQSHTTAINRSADVGFLTDGVATELEDLWKENRAHRTTWMEWPRTLAQMRWSALLARSIHRASISLGNLTNVSVRDLAEKYGGR
jgi:hypothetical protein